MWSVSCKISKVYRCVCYVCVYLFYLFVWMSWKKKLTLSEAEKRQENVSYPSPFRSTTATSYPKEDARPGPYKVCSTKSLPEASFSFFNRTTAPLWLALGAPATTVRLRLLVILCPESRENPCMQEILQNINILFYAGKRVYFLSPFLPNWHSLLLLTLNGGLV